MGLGWHDARRMVTGEIGRRAPAPPVEEARLADALGRVLAEEVLADRDQPPFDRSTRDGFAARAADLASPPTRLRIAGEVAAGAWFSGRVGSGECVEIMTGAPVPTGADAVLMVEHATRDGDSIVVGRAVAAGENIVPAGSEIRRGEPALRRGTRLDPAGLALAASLGCSRPRVFARPRVAIVTTGDELVEIGEAPAPAQIRNSNAVSLAAQVAHAGGLQVPAPIARDDRAALRAAFERALDGADLLLATGGVSMGKHDHVEGALADLGAEVVFDGVDIRPGKPVVFGRVRGRPFFGLPGNPLSTMVTFELFARPAVELLGGAGPPPLRFLVARLATDFRHRPIPLTLFLPAALDGEGAGVTVRPLPSRGSGDLASMARADVLMVVPPGTAEIVAGAFVSMMPK